ncbi:hypothetical protein AB0G15_05390 [Streptosporangium sp. NPDC023825]|uniref:hypothetical protein n=1 Tax=Streptosporangium sp. NPDC023825 TaxID=3154909 RepID=UPI0034344453
MSHNTLMQAHVQYPWEQANNPRMLAEDTLVEVRWGARPDDLTTWYGYVHHASMDTRMPEQSTQLKVAYTLIGTGHVLADAKTHVWREITDSGMATKIAKKYGLSSVVHKTKKIHKYLYQNAVSDYAWLQERAGKTGRKMWVENGCLYFVDIAAWAAARSTKAPEFEIHKDYSRPTDNFRFTADMGTDMPQQGRQMNRQMYGVDHKTGKFMERHNRDSASARTTVLRQPVADAIDDLDFQLGGHTSAGQEWADASADLIGSTRLAPGQPVRFKGRALPKHLRGEWMVVAADHHLLAPSVTNVGHAKFNTHVQLARNARDTYNFSDQTVLNIDDACVAGASWKARSIREVVL